MAPRSKRARKNSTSNEDEEVETQNKTLSKLKQHDALYFNDGNVVLATDEHLYCVHRSVLAKNSTVFSDMFELPNVGGEMGGSNEDSWDGKPVVRMVGDADGDVYHLLMTFYDLGFYSAFKPTTLPIIISLLRMSTKYNVPVLRQNVVDHVKRIYPCTLDDMTKRDLDYLFLHLEETPYDYDFQLLAVAIESGAKILLPMLYFECAILGMEKIIKSMCLLGVREQQKILLGYEKLNKLAYDYAIKSFMPNLRCLSASSACMRSRGQLLKIFMDMHSEASPRFPVDELFEKDFDGRSKEDKELRKSICKACSDKSATDLDAFRLQVWNQIPEIFKLGSWEDVTAE